MSDNHADAIAQKHLHKAWLEQAKVKFTLPPAFGYLEVGDRPRLPLFENQYSTVELLKVQMGADRSLRCEGKIIEAAITEVVNNYISVVDSGRFDSQATEDYAIVTDQGPTTLEILDINLISDRDPDHTIYLAGYGGTNWEEATVYRSVDDLTYVEIGEISDRGTVGTLATELVGSSSSFEVTLSSGTLESISPADADIGFNYLLVGNEILQFQTATIAGTDLYLIEDILARGLRGTETFIDPTFRTSKCNIKQSR